MNNCNHCKYWDSLQALDVSNDEDEFWDIKLNARNLARRESYLSKINRGRCTKIPSLSATSLDDPLTDFCVSRYDRNSEIDNCDNAIQVPVDAYISLTYFDPHNLDDCFVTSADFGCTLFEPK